MTIPSRHHAYEGFCQFATFLLGARYLRAVWIILLEEPFERWMLIRAQDGDEIDARQQTR